MEPEGADKPCGSTAANEQKDTELKEHRLPNNFPKGLRVLVVDDDPLCLKITEQMLKRCNYEVCTCATAATALEQLREKSHNFDLVLSDVYMPDMDGFKLLEAIGLELDLPVIMMSSNGEHTTVMRGVTHGACDFLIKPVRIEELRNIWQHVIRRTRTHTAAQQLREVESEEGGNEGDSDSNRKRKELCRDGSMTGERDDDAGSSKKPRVVWSVEMHQQFVQAVNQLGIDKAVPKKILELMKVDGLTRENVASHLQKYRLYLKRVQAVNPSSGMMGLGSRSKNGSGSGLLQQHQLAEQQQQQQQQAAAAVAAAAAPVQQQAAAAVQQAAQQVQQQVQQQHQQQQQQQPMAAGMSGMPGMGPGDMGLLGSLMGQNMQGMGLNPLNPMAPMMAGLSQGMMGMPGMPGLPGMPGMPALSQAAAAAASGQLLGQGMPGMPGGLGPLAGAMGMGPMGLPGLPGLPGAMQGMGLGPMAQMQATGMGMPNDPGSIMRSMMANMQAMIQQQQQAAAAAAAAAANAAPSISGGGSSGAPPHQQQQQPGMPAGLQQPPLMPGAPDPAAAAAAAYMAGGGMNPAAAAAAAAAMMGGAMQQRQRQQQAGGSGGGASSSGPGMAGTAAATTAAADEKPDFSHMFDEMFDTGGVPGVGVQPGVVAPAGIAAGGRPAGAEGAGVDEFLDYFLKS